MIKNMKSTLNRQIEDKRKRFDLEKEFHSKFNNEVVIKTVEQYSLEQKEKLHLQKEKIDKYREELDQQLNSKSKNVSQPMTDTEKEYNKKLLNKILSSPMMIKEC